MRGNLKRAEGRGTRADRPARSVRLARWLAVPVGMVVSSLLVWQASNAAFSDTTDNPGNNWASGRVDLADDDGGASAMFTVSNLKPGDSAAKCITVTYSGSLDASVKLFASAPSGTLAPYLNLTVEQGSGGSFGDCTGFSPDASPKYTGTLAAFAGTHQNWGNGWGSFTPTGGAPDDDKTYRFTYTLQDDDNAQGLSTGTTFTWEAQNTP